MNELPQQWVSNFTTAAAGPSQYLHTLLGFNSEDSWSQIDLKTRSANGVSPILRAGKDECPAQAARQRENSPFLHLFVLFRPPFNSLEDAH